MVERFERFSLAIFEISRCWHKLTAEEMAEYGLKGAHAMYLLVLKRSGGITAAQLGELCGRDKADVSRAMALMEDKGLVSRQDFAGNGYRAALSLTERGLQAAEHVCRRAGVAVEYAAKGYSEVDRAVFYEVLEAITANLQAMTKDGIPEA